MLHRCKRPEGELDDPAARLARDLCDQPDTAGAVVARALVELASDLGRARRMGEAGRERAMGKFQEHFCTDRTELLYREALGDATAALEAAALPVA